jgi:outer membrane lipoprotein SlyB
MPVWPLFACVVAVAGLLALDGCAPAAAPAADVGPAETAEYGVIVSLRPAAASGAVQANIMAAFGGPMAGGVEGKPAAAATEFIVREDSGNTISVVQANDDGLRPGDRVAVMRGARTRLARAAR